MRADASQQHLLAFDLKRDADAHGHAHLPYSGGAFDPLDAKGWVRRILEVERQLFVSALADVFWEASE